MQSLAPKRQKTLNDDHVFKCTASEGRSLLPVLAHFIRKSLLRSHIGNEAEHARCFLHLADAISELEKSGKGMASADRMRVGFEEHLRMFVNLYGEKPVIKKYHMSLHFPLFLECTYMRTLPHVLAVGT